MSNPRQRSEEQSAIAYIALGSNLGDREKYLRSAIAALGQIGTVGAISSFYETDPVGTIPQPDFLNAVVDLRTRLQPEELLTALLRIEQEHGRDRNAGLSKGPRTLDLDLLSYDALMLETPMLRLPHPGLAQRRFVLAPLAEIAPGWRHPVNGKTAVQLLDELTQQGRDGESGDGLPAVRRVAPQQQSSS